MLDRVLTEHPDISVVLHAAANPSVTAASADPLATYDANVGTTIRLLRRVRDAGIGRVVLSSSVAVYGSEGEGLATEDEPVDPPGLYARSKAMCEQVLADAAGVAGPRGIALRYTNPVGPAPDRDTLLRSRPPRTVLEHILSAQRAGHPFALAGDDWPTPDGSAVRDFVHVKDVAEANVAAILHFDDIVTRGSRFATMNIGSGRGTTVKELVKAVERVTGVPVEVAASARRPGEGMGRVPDISRARRLMRWRPIRSLDEAIHDRVTAATG